MRIRTDGDKEHRKATIDRVSNHYGRNKTDSLMLAADQVPSLHEAVGDVLLMESLTLAQRKEIAERFSRARGIEIDVETDVSVAIE